MIKAVIFDVDDTLINSSHISVEGIIRVSKEMSLPTPEEQEVRRLLGLPWRVVIFTLWPDVDIEAFYEHYDKYYYEEKREILASSGCVEAVRALYREKLTLGIITSRSSKILEDILQGAGFDIGNFHYIETNDQNNYAKPDPRVFDNLKREFAHKDIEAGEIVYVGDAIYDYQAARGAGLSFIAFLNGAYTKEEFAKEGLNKDSMIEEMSELPSKIRQGAVI